MHLEYMCYSYFIGIMGRKPKSSDYKDIRNQASVDGFHRARGSQSVITERGDSVVDSVRTDARHAFRI